MVQRLQVTEVSSPDLGVDVESDPFSSLERGPKGEPYRLLSQISQLSLIIKQGGLKKTTMFALSSFWLQPPAFKSKPLNRV